MLQFFFAILVVVIIAIIAIAYVILANKLWTKTGLDNITSRMFLTKKQLVIVGILIVVIFLVDFEHYHTRWFEIFAHLFVGIIYYFMIINNIKKKK